MKPLLPTSDRIASYLSRIDESRYYSNFGHLLLEYENRLSKLFGTPCITASSATSALTATLIAMDLPKGGLVACPSWTFQATPAAIVSAGHVPYFFDCGEDGVSFIGDCPRKISAVILVAPFGCQLDILALEIFNRSINIPIIIDAAAGFDSFSTICNPGKYPVVISTHATKPFGTGEGGFVTCTDEQLLKKIRHVTNFGIESKTQTPISGINAKMSEYHAAVGLAELDGWDQKREKWLQVRRWYKDALGFSYGDEFASSTFPVKLQVTVAPIVDNMQKKGINATVSRYGVHKLDAYKNYPRANLPNTEYLMDKTIMLPCAVDMTKSEIENVVEELMRCL